MTPADGVRNPSLLVVAEQLRRPVPGGIGTYLRGLLAGLEALGRDGPGVTLWASRGPRGRPDPLAQLGPPLVTSQLPAPLLSRAWDRGLARPRRTAVDVVHAASLLTPPPGPRPLSVMVHDLAWRRVPEAFPPRGRRWHEAALGRALERAELLVVPSEATASDLVAAGAPSGRVAVVEHGSDHLAPSDRPAAEALLRGAGVEGHYLLAVSTLEPRKNLPALVSAFQEARPRLPEPWPLVVAGPAGWGPALRPAEGVVLLGPVPPGALTALYSGARALAYVPLWEGFGLPALEAMACGVPVVASPMPSTAGAALQVSPRRVAEISDALVVAAVDEVARGQLVAAGRARAQALTWRGTARRHLELWRELVGGTGGKASS